MKYITSALLLFAIASAQFLPDPEDLADFESNYLEVQDTLDDLFLAMEENEVEINGCSVEDFQD